MPLGKPSGVPGGGAFNFNFFLDFFFLLEMEPKILWNLGHCLTTKPYPKFEDLCSYK